MGNKSKSKCQLRLEARSRAYQLQQQQQQFLGTSSSSSSSSSSLSDQQALAAQLHSRIAKATEIRVLHQKQRKNSARERVLHAQRVAQEQHAKRREELKRTGKATREKLEVARQRRRERLERKQQICKHRVQLVLEKVESVKEVQKWREDRQRRLLEGQLVDAARRREEQTQKMVRRLSERWHSVETVKDRVQRVKFIQRWYRRHVDARKNARSLQAVKSHVDTVVRNWQQIANTGFEHSMMLLQQRELARSAQYVLRVLLPSAAGNQSPKDVSPRSAKGASFRVLLMAGMIACHPNEIMEADMCKRLEFAAKLVYRDMQRIHLCLENGTSRDIKTCVSQLEARFAFYFDSFMEWKDRDAQRLAAEMLRSYDEIFRLKLRYASTDVAHEGDGMHELRNQTEKQLMQLKQALTQVIGKEHAVERVSVIENNILQSIEEAKAAGQQNLSASSQSVSSSRPAPAETTVAIDASSTSTSNAVQPPAQVESLLSDVKLVHELILNPQFKLTNDKGDDPAAASLERRVRESMLKAFWDQVVAANDIPTLLRRTEELRVEFTKVVHVRPELVERVNGALDSAALGELMLNPMENLGAMKLRCMEVLHAILQAESPGRNDSTRAFLATFEHGFTELNTGIRPPSDAIRLLVDFLAFALEKLEDIRMDLMNVHLGMLGAYLQRHGVEYEQKKLNEALAAGVQFSMTERWLAMEIQAYWDALNEADRERLTRYDADAFKHFLRVSFLSLPVNYIEGTTGVWPETFQLDIDRIRGVRNAMDRIAVISSLLTVLQEYLTRRRLGVPRDFFHRVGQSLSTLLLSPGISGAQLVAQAVQEARQLQQTHAAQNGTTDHSMGSELELLEQRLSSSFAKKNPIFTLFFSRIVTVLQSGILNDGNTGTMDIHPSLGPFEMELREIVTSMKKLVMLNERVYASLYNTIIKQLLASV